jgi:hypothetical protein
VSAADGAENDVDPVDLVQILGRPTHLTAQHDHGDDGCGVCTSQHVERVVQFFPSQTKLVIEEACDYWFQAHLTRAEVAKLIAWLQERHDEMID